MSKSLIYSLESLAREGKTEVVRRKLAEFRHRKVSRELVLPLARLARTANVPDIGIRHLNPIVRPSAKSVEQATEEEKAAYAALLIRIGASAEALMILDKLDKEKTPVCLLYEAYARVASWDYCGSIPPLLQYIRDRSLTPYEKILGQVNLAAAYVHEKQAKQANIILGELREITREKNLKQLYGNSLELSAQHAIFHGHWKDASNYLSQASQALEKSGGLDEFFVHKWRAILEILKNPKKIEPLKKIRAEATRRKHWETVRDCDRFQCIARSDRDLFLFVYFGTPFVEFRNRLVSDFGTKVEIPATFIRSLGKAKRATYELNLTGGGEPCGLKEGQTLYRLLVFLNSDFYRPFRLASIHAALYPEEFFNPRSSPDRVYQVMKRLRQWIAHGKLPLHVSEDKSTYQLVGEARIRTAAATSGKKKGAYALERLKRLWPKGPFSVKDAASALKVSERSTVRLLQESVKSGALVRSGSARSTRYRF